MLSIFHHLYPLKLKDFLAPPLVPSSAGSRGCPPPLYKNLEFLYLGVYWKRERVDAYRKKIVV